MKCPWDLSSARPFCGIGAKCTNFASWWRLCEIATSCSGPSGVPPETAWAWKLRSMARVQEFIACPTRRPMAPAPSRSSTTAVQKRCSAWKSPGEARNCWRRMTARCWRWRVATLPGSLRQRQALGHNRICRWIKRHADVGARNFEINLGIFGAAIPPVDNAIVARVDGGLQGRLRNFAFQRIHKIAGAAPGVAVGQDALSMLLLDALANRVRRMQHCGTGCGTPNRRGQRNHGSNVFGALAGNGSRNHAAETMANQVNFAFGFGQRPVHGVIQVPLHQKI